jgi:uncharacterized protein YndB with AHSA1/START domain
MVKIEYSIVIDRPIEVVWKYIIDLSNLPKWNTDILEAKQTSAGPLGADMTFQVRARPNIVHDAKVIEYEPSRVCTFEFITGPIKGSIEHSTLETVEGKTRFTRAADIKFNGFYVLLGPFLTPGFRKGYVTSLGNAKRILESGEK